MSGFSGSFNAPSPDGRSALVGMTDSKSMALLILNVAVEKRRVIHSSAIGKSSE
jgi:hypothetical protein